MVGAAGRAGAERSEAVEALRAVSESLAKHRGVSAEEEALRARLEGVVEQCRAENEALLGALAALKQAAETD